MGFLSWLKGIFSGEGKKQPLMRKIDKGILPQIVEELRKKGVKANKELKREVIELDKVLGVLTKTEFNDPRIADYTLTFPQYRLHIMPYTCRVRLKGMAIPLKIILELIFIRNIEIPKALDPKIDLYLTHGNYGGVELGTGFCIADNAHKVALLLQDPRKGLLYNYEPPGYKISPEFIRAVTSVVRQVLEKLKQGEFQSEI